MQTGKSSDSSDEMGAAVQRKTRSKAGSSDAREQLLRDSSSGDKETLTAPNMKDNIRGKRRKKKMRDSNPLFQPPINGVASRTLGVTALVISLIFAGSTLWLFFDIRGQTTGLRYQIEKVSAGTRDLPEQIQNCRSVNRQLKNDLVRLSDQMHLIGQKFDNFSVLIDHAQKALQDVQSKLHSYPELINVPNEIDSLSTNVANFGSQLQDIQLKTNQLSDDRGSLVSELSSVKSNLSALNDSMTNIKAEIVLENNKSKELGYEKIMLQFERQLSDKLIALNQSLSTRLNWTLTDQQNDHRTIDALQEKFANLSSQLQTFTEGFTSLAFNVSSLNKQVTSFKTVITEKTKSTPIGQRLNTPSEHNTTTVPNA